MKDQWSSFGSFLLLLFLLLAVGVCATEKEATENNNSTTYEIVEKWEKFDNLSRGFTRRAVQAIMSVLYRETEGPQLNISSTCMYQVMKVLTGLRNVRPWAFSLLDASSKIIDGMLMGTMSNLGEFDQCINTEATEDRKGRNHGKVIFHGQYCAIDIRPPLPPKKRYHKLNDVIDELKEFATRGTVIAEAAKSAHLFYMVAMRLGICIPSGCKQSDVSQITDRISEASGMSVTVKRCEVKEEKQFSYDIIAIMSIFIFLGFLLLMGTIIDIFCYYTERKISSTPLKVFVAFSFLSNFKKLASVQSQPNPLDCFSGLRVLSITWIILGHTYLNINYVLFRGLKAITEYSSDFAFQAVVNASVAVDTFFFMGGVLVCYLSVKLVKEWKKPFNITLYIIHRIFRILPVYSVIVAFMFLAPLFGPGPVWHDTIDPYVEACHKNWWSNLVFINNFYQPTEMCLPQSWYVACDMQLYIVALVVLLPLFRWPKVGLIIAALLIVASAIGNGALAYIMDHPPTMLFINADYEDRMHFMSASYFKPYSHAGPYFLGMLVGYLLVKNPKLQFSLSVRVLGWCAAIAINLSVLYGVWNWNKGIEATFIERVSYSGLHRIGWSVGVAWIVINCATGQGGVVNYILTWKCWKVLGKLTYSAYLIHPIVQISVMGMIRMKLQPWHFFAVWMFFGHLMITYGCSLVASMLVEAPFLSLEKIIFAKEVKELAEKTADASVFANGCVPDLESTTNGKLKPEQLKKENSVSQECHKLAAEDSFVCRL